MGWADRRLCRPPSLLRDGQREACPLRTRVFRSRGGADVARRSDPGVPRPASGGRVDRAATRVSTRAVASSRAAQASRGRARPFSHPRQRARGRREPQSPVAGSARRSAAAPVRNGDRYPLAGLVAALDRSRAAPVLRLADDLHGLTALAAEVGGAFEPARVAGLPGTVLAPWCRDR